MRNTLLLFGLALAISAPCSRAQVTLSGGKGNLRIHDAGNVYPGTLVLNMVYSGYGVKTKSGSFGEDHTLNTSLTLGLSERFEWFGHFVPYQDDQQHIWGPIGDTRTGLKFSFEPMNRAVQFGLLGSLFFPTAPNHNVMYEPFTADAYGWGVTGLVTFDLKNSSGAFPIKSSINFGYRDLDWGDRYFLDRKDLLIAGLDLKFPIRSSIFYSELNGEFFFNHTDRVAFHQNLIRFTQGFRFLGPGNLIFDLAADIELGRYVPTEKERALAGRRGRPFLKDYADWKILIGVSYRTTLFRHLSRAERLQKEQRQREDDKMETIRSKREKVAKELEELRKKLEQEKDEEP